MLAPHPYDLVRTLSCGQIFRWHVSGDGAACVFRGRVWEVRQSGRMLRAQARPPVSGHGEEPVQALWRHLGVDAPLRAVERRLARDEVLRCVLPMTSGIALMRQDPWECLISYVISAFNNIPKIRLTVEALARRYGEPVAEGHFSFPAPERLAEARLPALRSCILGYRAPYVRGVARAVADRRIDVAGLRRLPLPEARQALLALPGVGEKVADCVLLFALGHTAAFPVDVWIHRTVETLYLRGRRASARVVREWAGERFGDVAGYANQHLFAAARAGLLPHAAAF